MVPAARWSSPSDDEIEPRRDFIQTNAPWTANIHALFMVAPDWSREEVELIVDDYLGMLAAHLAGQQVMKSETRRQLQLRLNNRNDSSVERKRSNISAVVQKLGFHYLPGYKPLPNYQRILDAVVADRIALAPWLDEAALAAVQLPAIPHPQTDFSSVKTEAPRVVARVREKEPSFQAIRRDYVEREARNRSLGRAGEEFIVEYERWRLVEMGAKPLASSVEWVSQRRGDGLGFDIQSFEIDGTPRYIEVKTTAFGVATPFFLTDTELRFAQANTEQFQIYRLFDFRQAPRLFSLAGNPAQHCLVDPISYRASFS